MLEWLSTWGRGNRASDRLPSAEQPRQDRELARAIARDAIDVRFQPQFDVRTGQVAGVEALARWTGVDTPEELFRRAARARLSERLSRTVQRKALRAAGNWTGPLESLRISINLLAEDLARPGYECWLLDEIGRAGLTPDRVTVEITEGSLLADSLAAAGRLARLRAAGVRIAVDDFGTGYSSLAYLTTLPLDTLKIDRGLIADLVGGSRDRIVVRALIALARELKLQVVVEGVETEAQLTLLADWGCDLFQGFLGAGALDEGELGRFVEARAIRPRNAPEELQSMAHA
jgi:EAL domain-containing protein (putative c-di-GMP-specific phosphodiesterase class I)